MPRHHQKNIVKRVKDLAFNENEQCIQQVLVKFRRHTGTTYTAELCRIDGKRLVKLRFRGVPFFISNDPDLIDEAIKWHREFRRTYNECGVSKSQQAWDYAPPATPTEPPKDTKPYHYKSNSHGIVSRGYTYYVYYKAHLLGTAPSRDAAHTIMRAHKQFISDGYAYKRNQKCSA